MATPTSTPTPQPVQPGAQRVAAPASQSQTQRPAPPRPIAVPSRPAGAPAAAPAAAKPRPSRLGQVQRGRLKLPHRHLFYGPEKIGKSSLAADAPAPIFLDVEGGSVELEVARYPFRDGEGGHVPHSYEDVLGAIDDLLTAQHSYQTLVIDTVDALEALIHAHVCKANGKANIEAFGYGKGYKVALTEMRILLSRLDAIRARGMQVILLGHSLVKTFKNPEGEDFDRYQLCMHDLTAAEVKGWCDVIGFMRFDGGAAKLMGDDSKSARARGWSTGRRLIHLAREAAWDAGSRLSLPAEIELGVANPWAPFAAAKDTARDSTVESLISDILTEVDRITSGDRSVEFTTAAGTATSFAAINDVIARSDSGSLTRILAGLKATQPAQETA